MRFKVLALFVALQFASFALWQAVNGAGEVAVKAPLETHSVAATEAISPIHFTSVNDSTETESVSKMALENRTLTVLAHLPQDHAQSVESVIFDHDPYAHRGMGGQKTIIIKADMAEKEFVGVLVHETGHNVDLIGLESRLQKQETEFFDGDTPIYKGDPSLDFYRISWENEYTRKWEGSSLDFVSGYAMSDPFEDFAESYAYYVLHNKDFQKLAASNPRLSQKYRFMKYRVFDGQEFDTGYAGVVEKHRPWDVTVLPYELDNFLN
jgi:hypothetical protein